MVLDIQPRAHKELRNINNYHRRVAGVKVAKAITQQIRHTFKQLLIFPYLGAVIPEMEGMPYPYRSIVAHPHFKVIYRVEGEVIFIVSIWDCRQQPERLTF